jgi:hypothetical protein
MSEAEIDPPDTAKADDVPPDSIKEVSIEQPIVDEEEKKDLPTEATADVADAVNTADESVKRDLEEAGDEQDDAKKPKIENGGDKDDPDPIPASTEGLSSFNDADVLSGRGGGTNVHPGNRSFRDLINMHRRAYLKARKNDKPAISRAIVRSIRDANGRFLRKDEKTGLWFEIGDDAAREKTSQALRQRAPEMRKLLFDTEREEARSVAEDQLRHQRIMMGMPPDVPPGMPMPPMAYANPAYFHAMVANGGKPPGPPASNAQDPNYQQAMFQAAMMNNNINRYPPSTPNATSQV